MTACFSLPAGAGKTVFFCLKSAGSGFADGTKKPKVVINNGTLRYFHLYRLLFFIVKLPLHAGISSAKTFRRA
jgi:hypothetical protein